MAQGHVLPALPWDYAALEPWLDERTLRVHHQGHHGAHVRALNAAIEDQPTLQGRSALWLLLNLSRLPRALRGTVRHHAGGHVNHTFYWSGLAPAGGRAAASGPLADAIGRAFGGIEGLRLEFAMALRKLHGSGWVWLARDTEGDGLLHVLTTAQHLNPLMHGHLPLLVFDGWEHAYYLKHEDRRLEALEAWWEIVHWAEVELRFALSWRPRSLEPQGLPARRRIHETRLEN